MDRTKEFFAFFDAVSNRTTAYKKGKGDNVQMILRGPKPATSPRNSSFIRVAEGIGRDINSTTVKLRDLLSLVNKKSLFSDQPVRINELVSIIKRDIAKISNSISQLSNAVNDSLDPEIGRYGLQAQENVENITRCLQSNFTHICEEFKKILDLRSHNLKEKRARKNEYFQYTDNFGNDLYEKLGDDQHRNPSVRERNKYGSKYAMSESADLPETSERDTQSPMMDGPRDNQNSAQVMLEKRSSAADFDMLRSRSRAVDSIEATVVELGQMYQSFSNMINLQGQTIQRIDDNIGDVDFNMTGAQAQMAKYYKSISSNKWLILKILAVILFFFTIMTIFT